MEKDRARMPEVAAALLYLFLAACSGTTGKNPQGRNPDADTVVIVLPPGDASVCVNTPPPDASPLGPDPMCDPHAASVSYSRDIAPVLAGCSGEVCHAPWDYGTLVNQPSHACCDQRLLVAPNHPSFSLFTQALTGTDSCVGTMPQDGQLDPAEIQTMIAWVCQGALDN